MAVREFNFTVGPETSELPAIGIPTAPDDLVSLGFADDRYTQGSGAVADNATLKAMAEAERRDGDLVLIKDSNRLYRFNSAAADTDDGNFFLAPDAGTGRWVRVSILNQAVTFTDVTDSSSKDTGAMILEGGLGAQKNIHAGGNITADGNLTVSGTTDSSSKDTGAVILEGGMGVEKNIHVGGNATIDGDLTVSGTTTTIDVDTLEVEDPNVLVNRGGDQSTANTAVSGLTVSMSDATDFRIGYDSTLASKLKAGEVGSESEIITAAGDQVMTGKKSFDSADGTDFDSITAPATPAADTGRLYFSSADNSFHQIDDLGADQSLVGGGGGGSGTGEINYIENFGAESNTDGWALYKDAAQSTPEDGTGGASGLVFNRQTGVVLRDLASFEIVKDAADREGEGVSYDFSIKGQDVSKKLKIQFDFKTDQDAGYISGDFAVYILADPSGTPTLITPSDTALIRGQNIFQTSFNSTTATDYRLIFHCTATHSNAFDVYIDNVIVGPGMTSQGAAIGEWTEFTPTYNNLTQGSGAVNSGWYRRVGDSMEIRTEFTCGSGAAKAGDFELNMPAGFTIDSDRVTLGQRTNTVGFLAQRNDNGFGYMNWAFAKDSSTFAFALMNAGTGPNVDGNEPFSLSANDVLHTTITIPILQFAGKGIVPMLAEDNLSEWQSYTPTYNNVTVGTGGDNRGWYRRVGDSMEWRVQLTFGTGGGVSANFDVIVPDGLTVDTSAMDIGLNNTVGVATAWDASGARWIGSTVMSATTVLRIAEADGTVNLWDTNDPITWASGDTFSMSSTIPIAEWAGSQNSLVGYSLASDTQAGLMPAFSSGTFTPLAAAEQNVVLRSDLWNTARYIRMGNLVYVSGVIGGGVNAADAVGIISLSVPIASTFSADTDITGSGAYFQNTTTPYSAVMIDYNASYTYDVILHFGTDSLANSGNRQITYSYMYEIV